MRQLEKVKWAGDFGLYRVKHESLPKATHILCMPSAHRILYNPLVCGMPLRNLSLECSKEFLRTAWALLPQLNKIKTSQIGEIVVLRGSLGYQFDAAFEQIFGRYLPRCFVGVRRRRTSGGEFGADVFYTNFDALPDNGFLFMGDTIATGVSLGQTMAMARSELRERDYDVKGMFVFTIAGALKGCSKLLDWEERFREWWPSFRIHLFAAEGLFGLAGNGTDLLFRKKNEAILPDESKLRVTRAYGDYELGYLPGKICAIFDWGDRNFKPERHLSDVLKFSTEHIRITKESKAREVLKSMNVGAKGMLRKIDAPLPAPQYKRR
ncbi:MAG: hypothetical protein AB1476_04955 [Candidatus Hadarchaeota archaeon]